MKVLVFLTAAGVSAFLAFTAAAAPARPAPPVVASLENEGFITGDKAPGRTYTRYRVGGTDLGFPAYSAKDGRMYLFFGDTFEKPETLEGDWRSNVVGIATPEELLARTIPSFATDRHGHAIQAINGWHIDKCEMTKIPTGAIEIGGTMYMFYFSMNSWSNEDDGKMNYGGCVKSVDGCRTWKRVNDLSWINHPDGKAAQDGKGNASSSIAELVRQDVRGDATTWRLDYNAHVGHGFTQIFPLDGKDGFIYLFGEGGFRSGPVRLARVAANCRDFEDFSAWEYMTGTAVDGTPTWTKGAEGLKTAHNPGAPVLFDDRCGEMSVAWNAYLGKWLCAYTRENAAEKPHLSIRIRVADRPWGPWSDAVKLFDMDFPFGYECNSVYGGFFHERLTEDGGRVAHLIYSQYSPVYQSSMMKVTFQREQK